MLNIEKLACTRCGGIEFQERKGVTLRKGSLIMTLPELKTHQCVRCGYEGLPKDSQDTIWSLARVVEDAND
jgi:ribosomal protein L37E